MTTRTFIINISIPISVVLLLAILRQPSSCLSQLLAIDSAKVSVKNNNRVLSKESGEKFERIKDDLKKKRAVSNKSPVRRTQFSPNYCSLVKNVFGARVNVNDRLQKILEDMEQEASDASIVIAASGSRSEDDYLILIRSLANDRRAEIVACSDEATADCVLSMYTHPMAYQRLNTMIMRMLYTNEPVSRDQIDKIVHALPTNCTIEDDLWEMGKVFSGEQAVVFSRIIKASNELSEMGALRNEYIRKTF